MSMEEINAAAQALRALEQECHGKIAAINQTVAQKKGEVDNFLSTAREKLTTSLMLSFDPTVIYSKNGLNLADDPLDLTKTVWHQLTNTQGGYYLYGITDQTHFAALMLAQALAVPPGFYEQNKYASDKSYTEMDFIVAPHNSQNLINTTLASKNIIPAKVGSWSFGAETSIVPILDIPNQDSAKSLFVRFRNRAFIEALEVPENAAAQAVATFGGNSQFSIHQLNVHKK
jgi:hypothetical protein